jgi:hypothetical protein
MRWRWRRRETTSPPRPAGPEVRLERERYLPGETVRGAVVVPEGAGVERIEVSLNFRERSTEYEATTVTIPGGRLDEGDPAPGGGHRFAIELPDDALPSQSGRHGALSWTVDATMMGSSADRVVSARIEVAPPPR